MPEGTRRAGRLRRALKYALYGGASVLALLVAACITVVGPWPTYGPSPIEETAYYPSASARLAAQAAALPAPTQAPGRLQAGWGRAAVRIPEGTPLAGYGKRDGAPSIGSLMSIQARALALSDGADTAVLTSCDLLILPENVAEVVRERVAAGSDLEPRQILFNATHTHSGPGGWGPGLVAALFAGPYDAEVATAIADALTEAILEAHDALEPAALAVASFEAGDLIANRAREAETDALVQAMAVRRDDGSTAHVVRFSAHATILGADNLLFHGDYPGVCAAHIEERTGGTALFLAGAMGSMRPRWPGPESGYARVDAYGRELAARALEALADAAYATAIPVRSLGVPIDLPPAQVRFRPNWRLSPLLPPLLGVDGDGWFQAVRVGDAILTAMPGDFSGESAIALREAASRHGADLWALGFNGDYAGYISPDRYYATARRDGTEGYEMYVMSWCGPNQEAYFAGLADVATRALFGKGG